MKLGERIYKLRAAKSMSQGELADALGVSRQSVSKWETDASVPELEKLVKLSEVFDISLDELIAGKAKREEVSVAAAVPVEPQIIYVEKPVKPNVTVSQILGIILLSCSLLCFVLFACFGKRYDLFEVFILCLPVAVWGILCLVTKHPLLWCGWCGSVTWWIYLFILASKWESAILLLLIGILLVAAALSYTIYLHIQKRIDVPAWVWALLTIGLCSAALLLAVNLIPPVAGEIARPAKIESITP